MKKYEEIDELASKLIQSNKKLVEVIRERDEALNREDLYRKEKLDLVVELALIKSKLGVND